MPTDIASIFITEPTCKRCECDIFFSGEDENGVSVEIMLTGPIAEKFFESLKACDPADTTKVYHEIHGDRTKEI